MDKNRIHLYSLPAVLGTPLYHPDGLFCLVLFSEQPGEQNSEIRQLAKDKNFVKVL